MKVRIRRSLILPLAVFGSCLVAASASAALTFTNFGSLSGLVSGQLLQGPDGNFYGTTSAGAGALGTVFKATPGEGLTNLFTFDYGVNGTGANWLLAAADGSLYGVTSAGGTNHYGTIFQIATNGTFSTLFNFQGTNDAAPGNIIQGTDGNFYGTTFFGGTGFVPGNPGSASTGFGTVFQFSTNGTLTVLAAFNGTNGSNPDLYQSLIQGPDGNFYGTTDSGGTDTNLNNANGWDLVGHGTVFQMSPTGSINTLVSFDASNGGGPVSGLLWGNDGQLYGLLQSGGAYHRGAVFQTTTNGALAIIASLDGTNTSYPICLAQAPDGTFYGGSHGLGASPYANIFQLSRSGSVTPLYSFSGGAYPNSLMQAADGNFYGTTLPGSEFGKVFQIAIPAVPVLQSVNQSGAKFSQKWTAVAGQSYQLQYRSDLTLSNWMNLGSAITATNGSIKTSDNIGPDPQRFYRLVLLP